MRTIPYSFSLFLISLLLLVGGCGSAMLAGALTGLEFRKNNNGVAEEDICNGQENTNNWYYEKENIDTKAKTTFGPYKCKKHCQEVREAKPDNVSTARLSGSRIWAISAGSRARSGSSSRR